MAFFVPTLRPSLWKKEDGFILIEVAVALIIFGLILGPGFIAWRTHNTIRQQQITRQHQELIFQALGQHLEFNGCLPKPSAISSQVWGENTASYTGVSKPGIVPYRTLGLPARVAKDGFGHWMTYAVDSEMTTPGVRFQCHMCTQFLSVASKLDVIEGGKSVQQAMETNHQRYQAAILSKENEDQEKFSLHFKERFNGIAVILVSHGYNGWGAPKAPGLRNPVPPNATPAARMNADDTLTFATPDQNLAQSANQCIVAWKTRSQMMAQAHLSCMDVLFRKQAIMPKLTKSDATPSYSKGVSLTGRPNVVKTTIIPMEKT